MQYQLLLILDNLKSASSSLDPDSVTQKNQVSTPSVIGLWFERSVVGTTCIHWYSITVL